MKRLSLIALVFSAVAWGQSDKEITERSCSLQNHPASAKYPNEDTRSHFKDGKCYVERTTIGYWSDSVGQMLGVTIFDWSNPSKVIAGYAVMPALSTISATIGERSVSTSEFFDFEKSVMK
jgi:hypothetical protein